MRHAIHAVFLLLGLVTQMQAQQQSKWREDIEHLAERLPKLHKNAFHKISKDKFLRQAKALQSRLETLDDHVIVAEIGRLVASIGDGHTALVPDYSNASVLPVQFYWFQDGLFVTRATPSQSDAFGGKVTKLGEWETEQALDKLKPFLSLDNHWQFKNQGPRVLGFGETLHAVGIWKSKTNGSIEFEKNGKRTTVELRCISMTDAKKINWVTRTSETPKYLLKQQLPCWNDWLSGPESKTMYFRYNRCEDSKAFQRLVNGSVGFIQQQNGGVQRFVLDLRGNGGGNSAIFKPLLQYLSQNKQFNESGNLIIVVDRFTFSSAVLNAMELRNATGAIICGEPTGGKPNHFGEVRSLELPNSKLKVQYSTKYFVRVKDSDPAAVMPDIEIEPTFNDWLTGHDPVIEKILSQN